MPQLSTERIEDLRWEVMRPLWMAPDVVPLSKAHEYLPWCRTTVYKLYHCGKIEAERLPRQLYVTRAELLRLRGRNDEWSQTESQNEKQRFRPRRTRPIGVRG